MLRCIRKNYRLHTDSYAALYFHSCALPDLELFTLLTKLPVNKLLLTKLLFLLGQIQAQPV